MIRDDILNILKQQVKPARGCTEPVAVALAVSTAYREIKGNIEQINIKLSPNIYKNGMRVGIPGTKEKGIIFAVALSVICADPSLGLELFKNVNNKCIEETKELISKNRIKVEIEDNQSNLFIEAKIKTDKGQACCIVKDSHTNIVYLEADGKVVYSEKDRKCAFDEGFSTHKASLSDLSVKEIKDFVESVAYEDIEFLLDGVMLNITMANKGLEGKIGLGAGMSQLLQKGILRDDIVNKVRILTSSACDARMAGINLPVMSSAGSGNHGITAIIPPTVVSRYLGYDDKKLARALVLSHLITAYIKEYTGKLSPVCGCSIAAGIGASASIAWLLGGSYEQIVGAISNMVGAIVDIGSETTTVSLYNKAVIVKNSIIGVGGKALDNDLVYSYKVSKNEARKIKETFALAYKKYASVSDFYESKNELNEDIKINQYEVSEIASSRLNDILELVSKEISSLSNRELDYIIFTGGVSEMAHFNYLIEEKFGKKAAVGSIRIIGVRNNIYSAAVGNIIYFISKLKLKGKNYSMVSTKDSEDLSSVKKNNANISSDSMLGKVVGYFFGE